MKTTQTHEPTTKSFESFSKIQLSAIPNEIRSLLKLFDEIEFPVNDHLDFRTKLDKLKSENNVEETLKNFMQVLFTPNDFPLSSLQGAVEKFTFKLESEKGKAKHTCKCNDQPNNGQSIAMMRNDAAENRCKALARGPMDYNWYNFCECIYETDNSIWRCLWQYFDDSLTA
jgi:hypothetical protein